jgi:hypothetical protein
MGAISIRLHRFASDPLAAALPAGVWLTRGDNKNHWLASELCDRRSKLFGIVARGNRRKAAKVPALYTAKFANHNDRRPARRYTDLTSNHGLLQ